MKFVCLLLAISCIALACTLSRDGKNEMEAIREIDAIQRKAHYEKDAALLGSIMADSFYVVNKGKLSWSTRDKMVKNFGTYFKQISYSHWENIDSPLVDLDNDLAVVTYHKMTISTESGSALPDTAVFGWASVLKKNAGKWQIKGIVTTDDQ